MKGTDSHNSHTAKIGFIRGLTKIGQQVRAASLLVGRGLVIIGFSQLFLQVTGACTMYFRL